MELGGYTLLRREFCGDRFSPHFDLQNLLDGGPERLALKD